MNLPKLNRVAMIAAALGGVVLVALGGVVMARMQGEDLPEGALATFAARRGPLPITVSVSGAIANQDVVVVKSEVEGRSGTAVLWLIEQGTEVKEGDLLVQLDGAEFEDTLVDMDISVQNADAALTSAKEELEVTKNQAKADVDQATLDLELASLDLAKYLEGDYPAAVKEAEAQLTLALGDQKRAEDRLRGSERLAEKDFITADELEADRLAALRAKLDVQLAEEAKMVLTEFEHKRTIAELESAVSQAELALERVKRKANADVVQAEAQLGAKQLEFNRTEDKRDDVARNLEATKVYAPAAGTVVYATSGRDSYRGREEPLEEGATVRERQELIHLPTTDAFMAKVDVHESSVSKLTPGMAAKITVETMPDMEYYGRVSYIAPMPDARSQWMNPDLKIYDTHVNIEGDTAGLRSGTSCEVEIVIKEYDDAIYIPVQAVVRVAGETVVYLPNGDTRKVEIGLDNNRMICILDGLAEGEEVLLNPPLADESALEEEEYVSPTTKLSPLSEQPAAKESAAPAQQSGQRPEGDAPNMQDMRRRFENATPEQREQMRNQWEERMKNMSDEERQQMMERMRQRGGRGGGGGGRGGGGGARGEGAGPSS